jgi:hypothetical protein
MRSGTYQRRVSTILILASLGGCGQGNGPEGASGSARDLITWNLSPEPIYSVTESSSEPAYILHQAWSGLILEDGTAVIANAGDGRLIFLDSLGMAFRVTGGRGGGPGEFSSQMWMNGETESGFSVRESSGRRISFFTWAGDFLKSISVPSPPGGSVFGYLDGSGVVTASFNVPVGAPRSYHVISDSATVVAVLAGPPEPAPPRISWLGVVDIPAAAALPGASVGPREITINTMLPFGCAATSDEVTIGSEIFSMDAVNGVIQAQDIGGVSRTVYRADSRVKATAELHQSLQNELVARPIGSSSIPVDTIANAIERYLPVGSLLPTWTSMIADPTGRLWLRSQTCTGVPIGSEEYEVISLDGKYLGTISVSDSRRVLAVRGNRVLVTWSDELGIERVGLYRLEGAEEK